MTTSKYAWDIIVRTAEGKERLLSQGPEYVHCGSCGSRFRREDFLLHNIYEHNWKITYGTTKPESES